MKSFNFDVDDCFDSACTSLSKEMGSCKKANLDLDLTNKIHENNNPKKKKISLSEKLEIVCLIILVKFFV